MTFIAFQNCGKPLSIGHSDGSTPLCNDGQCLKPPPDDPPPLRPPDEPSTNKGFQWKQIPKRTLAQKVAGLSGGEGWQMIFGISFAPSNPSTAYVVVDTNQVWKSTDSGFSWTRKAVGFLANGGISLIVDPLNENIVYVAGGVVSPGMESLAPVESIFRTIDGGNSWAKVQDAYFPREAQGGVHLAFAGTAIYAAPTNTGILKSMNGTSWTTLRKADGGKVLDSERLFDIKSHPTNSRILYVCANSGLWKITDSEAGVLLTKIGNGLPVSPFNIQIDRQNPNILYAAVGTYGVYRSTDGGLRFSPRNNGLADPIERGGGIRYMAISPIDPNRLIVNFQRIFGPESYYTFDGGSIWQKTTSMDEQNSSGWIAGSVFGFDFGSGTDDAANPIAFHPSNKEIALTVGWGNQIKKTTDGGRSWKYSNSGYTGAGPGQFGSNVASWDPTAPHRATFFHMDFGAMLTADSESTFKEIANADWNGRRATLTGAMHGNIIVAAIGPNTNQRIHISRDSGETWTPVAGADGNFKFIAFHPQNPNILYAGKYKFSNIKTNNTFTTLTGSVSGIFKGNGNIVYGNGNTDIVKSIDGGSTWIRPYPPLNIPSGHAISQIAIDPLNEDRIYAAVRGKGVYVTTNTHSKGGIALVRNEEHGIEKDQFDQVSTVSVVTDPNNSNVVYAAAAMPHRGQSNGVFRSVDGGTSWINITGNLGPQLNVTSLSVNPFDSYVYLGSSVGSWKLPPPP